jgi:lipopolysaccharide transport system permease protein
LSIETTVALASQEDPPSLVGAPEQYFSTVIRPTKCWAPLNLRALWRYRELLYFLTWRDVKVRYKQTALGAAWAVIQPVLTMVLFTVIFGHFAKIPSDGVPYPIFSYTALLPWTFFAYAMSQSANSLVGSANLISKVYFPRLVIPIASCLAGVMDFAIAFVVLLAMMVFYHVVPSAAVVTLPLFLLLTLVAGLAVGIWLSALNVQYRDVRYAVPFLTQIWLYATPVAYGSSFIKGPLHYVLALNPMTGVVDGFRWAILGQSGLDVTSFLLSTSVTVLTLIGGLFYFRRMEQQFADVV